MIIFFYGCGNSYHYYAPPLNHDAFANKNEFHCSANAGITGNAIKSAYSINDFSAISSGFHFSSPVKYRGSEFETTLMLGKRDSSSFMKIFSAGCGFGSNYEKKPEATLKDFRGQFIKPFAMITFGTAHNSLPSDNNIFYDLSFSVKANYLIYRGFKATTLNSILQEKKFNANVFFAEPYFSFNFGAKWIRMETGLGLLLKKKYSFDKNIAVFPIEANAGLVYVIGRKYSDKKEE